MRLLFAISVGCFLAMFWVAVSVARRLKRDRAERVTFATASFPQEFFEAGEFRTPRTLKLLQDAAAWRPRQSGLNQQATEPLRLSTLGQSALASKAAASADEQAKSSAPRPVKMRRIDLSRFRENPGDFTDPYSETALPGTQFPLHRSS